MCRKNKLLGSILISFAAGVFLGSMIDSGFWCGCVALCACGLGIAVIRII